jgi:hypothetical protein
MNRGTSILLVATGVGIAYATLSGTMPFILLALLYPQYLSVVQA